jgi:hypothetical protein
VLPRLAPSITASAGASSIAPLAANEAANQPGRRAALQYRGHRQAGQRGIETRASSGA